LWDPRLIAVYNRTIFCEHISVIRCSDLKSEQTLLRSPLRATLAHYKFARAKHTFRYNKYTTDFAMPPKKKNNKKDADDWEEELSETPAPAAEPETKDEPVEADAEDEFPAGGLMAMMRKKQKKKKGKQTEDFVEGEGPPAEEEPDLAEKAPVEASIDDEFALPDKKGKGKSAPAKPAGDDEDDERGADGKVLTKAQKEKLKKEREKQRKKENVSTSAEPLPVSN
jgi:translation initiation factor 5B